ncbi:MAG: hypothetical protein AAF401_00820, partial [Pseudomonadota bacterium]
MKKIEFTLDSDEHIIWSGSPDNYWGSILGDALRGFLIATMLIMFANFFVNQSGYLKDIWISMRLFSFLFFIVFAVVMGCLVRNNTFYAITNQRALIRDGYFWSSFRSYPIGPHNAIEVEVGHKSTVYFWSAKVDGTEGPT